METSTKNKELTQMRKRLGQNILRRREELGYSQEKLAYLSQMGVAHLGNIERGSDKNNPTLSTLLKIAKGLDTTVEKLLEGTGTAPDELPPDDGQDPDGQDDPQ